MATMNISLPESMKSWIESQVKSGKFGNTSDFVRDLIRKEQDKSEKIARIQAAVDEGIASGVGKRSMLEIKKAAMARLNDGV